MFWNSSQNNVPFAASTGVNPANLTFADTVFQLIIARNMQENFKTCLLAGKTLNSGLPCFTRGVYRAVMSNNPLIKRGKALFEVFPASKRVLKFSCIFQAIRSWREPKKTARRSDSQGNLPPKKRPRIDIKNPIFWGHTARHTFVEPLTEMLPFHSGTQLYNYKSK